MHTHQFWWAVPLRFWRYCYLQKRPNFPFRPWTWSSWSSKNSMVTACNKLSPPKLVCMHVTLIHTCMNFFSRFRSIEFFDDHGLNSKIPWSSKNSIDRNRLKKFMHVWIDVTCIHTNFGGRCLFGFGDTVTFKISQFSLSDHGL